MPEEIFILGLVGIVSGTSLIAFIAWNIFSVIRSKTGGSSKGGELDPQFFRALSEFKKSTERRMTNLETIVADLEEERIRVPSQEGEILIEPEEVREPKKESPKNDSNLRNMLDK
ncbi:MAG: hypothetical protein AAFW89_11920 [Bacteroidota bacterium]